MIPKFRAWQKTWEEMCKVKRLRFDDEGNVTKALVYGKTSGMNSSIDEIVLMQSTGLHDKNDKEIFEGDIVQFFDSLYTVFYNISEGSYQLEPHDERWVVDYMSNFSSEETFEIIGNIYENSELLEVTE